MGITDTQTQNITHRANDIRSGGVKMKALAFCIGILIGDTILMIISFIYRLYWDIKLKKEINRRKTQPLENATINQRDKRNVF